MRYFHFYDTPLTCWQKCQIWKRNIYHILKKNSKNNFLLLTLNSQVIYGRNKRIYEEANLCVLVMHLVTAWSAEMAYVIDYLKLCPAISFDQLPPEAHRVQLNEVIVSSQCIKKIHMNPDRSWNQKCYEMKLFCLAQWRNSGRACLSFCSL